MVCNRCIMVVEAELKKRGLKPTSVKLGEAQVAELINENQLAELKNCLENLGFELIEDKRKQMVEQIKSTIINLVHYQTEPLQINLSDFLKEKINRDYTHMSNIFSEIEQTTIEKYFINQKIERAKELLSNSELTLSEIAFQLNYSSVAHLSAQFKKTTKLTPTEHKRLAGDGRKVVDSI